MAASAKIVLCILAGGLFCHLAACGYSQEEWDQKVHENAALTQQMAAQKQASDKCAADYGAASTELEALKGQFQERGVSLDNMSNDLAQQRQANEEYRKRAEQLEQVRQRFEQLQQKLKKLTELGLKEMELNIFYLLHGPAGLPADLTARLNRSSVVALTNGQTRERFVNAGMQAWDGPNTPESSRDIVDRELKRFAAIGERTGIKISG